MSGLLGVANLPLPQASRTGQLTARVNDVCTTIDLFKEFLLGYPGLPGYGLTAAECKMVQRFGPPQFFKELGLLPLRDHLEGKEYETENLALDTVCFFIAKFIKI